jgi:hypothetical protein
MASEIILPIVLSPFAAMVPIWYQATKKVKKTKTAPKEAAAPAKQ